MAKSDPDERLAKLKRELGWTGDAPPQAKGPRVLAAAVTDRLEPAADLLTRLYRRFQELHADASARVRTRPAASLLAALGSGYALGRVFGLLRRTGAKRRSGRIRAVAPAREKAAGGFDLDAALQAATSLWRLVESRLDLSKVRAAAGRLT